MTDVCNAKVRGFLIELVRHEFSGSKEGLCHLASVSILVKVENVAIVLDWILQYELASVFLEFEAGAVS